MGTTAKIHLPSRGKNYSTAEEAVNAFKCPGPCSPDCPLYFVTRLPNGNHGHKCHPDYIAAHPHEVIKLIGGHIVQDSETDPEPLAKNTYLPNKNPPDNFFLRHLPLLCDRLEDIVENPIYAGRSYAARLSNGLIVRAEFTKKSDVYLQLTVRVLNKNTGEIDRIDISFNDACGDCRQPIGFILHGYDEPSWYTQPPAEMWNAMADMVYNYVNLFAKS